VEMLLWAWYGDNQVSPSVFFLGVKFCTVQKKKKKKEYFVSYSFFLGEKYCHTSQKNSLGF
jgi:hypothetical protein